MIDNNKYVVLKFATEKELDAIWDAYDKEHGSKLPQADFDPIFYGGECYQMMPLVEKNGDPILENLFFIRENSEKIVEIDIYNHVVLK